MIRKASNRRNPKRESGQAVVEFAIVIPVLLLVVFGIIQGSILFNNYMALTDAVRVGARQAAVGRTAADPVGQAEAKLRNAADHLDQADLNVTITPADPATWQQGGDVTVKATYPFEIDLLGIVVASGQLTSETTERVE